MVVIVARVADTSFSQLLGTNRRDGFPEQVNTALKMCQIETMKIGEVLQL